MELLSSLISSTNWMFVLIATVVSMVVGMFWYGKFMFGNVYGRWMKLPPMGSKSTGDDECTTPEGVVMLLEFVSRALYFIGLGWAFSVAPEGGPNSWLCFAIIIWLVFSLSTQISAVIRSPANPKVLWIVGTKMLLDTVLAAILWYVIL